MPTKTKEVLDLKEACVQAAREVISERGVENLSLREVARKLGVSHQAPYRHYQSRDHLLAEVVRRCFMSFARELDARDAFDAPDADLESLGRAYLKYAALHPLEYRLMFNTPWPDAAEHPALIDDAIHAFDVLRGVLRRIHGAENSKSAIVDLDAMFIWSTMHGLASITQSNVMEHLKLSKRVSSETPAYAMQMISSAMANRTQ